MTPGTNGRPKPLPEKLADLRESAKRARLTASLRRAEAETKLYESLCWGDDFNYGNDLWDRVRGRDGSEWIPIVANPSDRKHGENWPLWRTEVDLDRLRQGSRMLLGTNGLAQSLLSNLTNFVIGDGFKYKVQSKELQDADPDTPGDQEADDARARQLTRWVRQAQDVVDRFLRVNRWNGASVPKKHDGSPVASTREREVFRRTYRDGEAPLRLFRDEGRRCLLVRFVEPEQVRDPPGASPRDGWSFGVRHQMEPYEDVETRVEYHVRYQDPTTAPGAGGDQGEMVPAEEIVHVLRHDADATVARGCPFFSFGTFDALMRAEKLQRNTSIGAATRAAVAEIEKWATGTREQIADLASGLASAVRPDPGTGKQVVEERRYPGMIRRVPQGYEPVFPAPDNTAAYLSAGEGDKQYAAAAACGPSYWLGDQASANYSNLETASAPPVKNGQAVQEHFTGAFARVVWAALEYAAELGDLEREALDHIDLQVDPPAVLHRNELEDAQVRSVEAQNGVLSPQTWCAEKGRDYEIESANIAEHRDRVGGAGPGLGLPGDQPPGQGGDDPFGGGGGGPPAGDLADPAPAPTGQADAVQGNDLRTTVGGLNAIAALQSDYYGGKVPREAAVANVRLLFGFSGDEAASLFPEVAPTKLAPDAVPAAPPGLQESLEARLLEDGFTGVDRHGHKWVNGRQVKRDEAGPSRGHARRTRNKLAKAGPVARATAGAGAAVGRVKGALKAVWARVPKPVRKAVVKTIHTLEFTMRKGKELAMQAAVERGLTPEHAARVGRILGAVDLAGSFGAVGLAHNVLHHVGAGELGALLGSKVLGNALPLASLGYVAYSTARNPLATIRAAHKVLTGKNTAGVVAHAHESLEHLLESAAGAHRMIPELLDRVAAAGDHADWYEALVMAALDGFKGDLPNAIEVADSAFKAHPKEPAE